jgi:hypothetical protein
VTSDFNPVAFAADDAAVMLPLSTLESVRTPSVAMLGHISATDKFSPRAWSGLSNEVSSGTVAAEHKQHVLKVIHRINTSLNRQFTGLSPAEDTNSLFSKNWKKKQLFPCRVMVQTPRLRGGHYNWRCM